MDDINSGRARGGPYNGQTVHHHLGEYRVAIAADDQLKALPAQQGPSEQYPNVAFGSYIYQPGLEEWWWDESTVSLDRVRQVLAREAKS